MQKRDYVMLSLIMFVAIFAVVGQIPTILADENNSGSGSTDNSDISDNSGNSDEDSDNEDEVEDNENESEDEENEFKLKREIKIKGGEFEIETELEVEGEGSNLSFIDSEGKRHKVKVTIKKIKILIEEELNGENISNFSLEEITHKNIPRVVFKVNSDHPGRFVGIFKLVVKAETQIDPGTGEILDFNTPWWVFLVVGEGVPDPDEIVGNETLEDEIIASDEELEDEFDGIEVDEELEIKAESFNGTSKVKIELEFDTATLNTNEVISEILGKLNLSSEEIDGFLEIEESDEPLEDKDELEVEIESDDDLIEAEFELKFIVNSDNREDVVSAIVGRLSGLTSEDIINALETADEEEEEASATSAQGSIEQAKLKISEAEDALAIAQKKGIDFSSVEKKIIDAKEKLVEAEALYAEADFAAVIDKAEDAKELAEDALDALEDILEDIQEEETNETNSSG